MTSFFSTGSLPGIHPKMFIAGTRSQIIRAFISTCTGPRSVRSSNVRPSSFPIQKRGTLSGTVRNLSSASIYTVESGSMNTIALAPNIAGFSQLLLELKSISTMRPSTSIPLKSEYHPFFP